MPSFYAVEYAYGSTVVNNGQREDKVYEFSAKRLRDAWVESGPADVTAPGYRANAHARDALVRKADYRVEGDGEGWYVLARRRVDAVRALSQYNGVIFQDWPETDHCRWVATATEREIVAWAKAIEEAQQD